MTTKTKTTHWSDFAGNKGALLSRHSYAWHSERTVGDTKPQWDQSSAPSRAWLVPMGVITLFMLAAVLAM
jgi:hypothetical protein